MDLFFQGVGGREREREKKKEREREREGARLGHIPIFSSECQHPE